MSFSSSHRYKTVRRNREKRTLQLSYVEQIKPRLHKSFTFTFTSFSTTIDLSSMSDSHDYEYMNESSISEDLMCPICTSPLEEPVCADQCGHTFCRECITKTFQRMSQCPTCRHALTLDDFRSITTRPFLNQLNQLLVECKRCSKSGIQRGDFKAHIATCAQSVVPCPAATINCDWKGKRDELQSHVVECPLIKVQPIIVGLNEQVKQQADQIRFLYTILKKISKSHIGACHEEAYRSQASAYCDACSNKFTFDSHRRRLHYCPNTDFCSDCVKKHLP